MTAVNPIAIKPHTNKGVKQHKAITKLPVNPNFKSLLSIAVTLMLDV
jgi:hypothetical protein